MTWLDYTNQKLDRAAHVAGNAVSPFRVCTATALGLATVVALGFAVLLGLSPAVVLLLLVVNLLAAFALGLTIKVVTGSERHTHYHYEIVVAVVSVITLWSLGLPVLPYLDVLVIGKGVLLAIGRVGCFMVGCCHGRPCRMGVCYSEVKSGFARHYLGVRLLPIQLIESLIVWFLTGLGGYLLLSDAQPGTSLSVYVVGYGSARFFIEFLRGDPHRPYFWSFSEAQWTALLLLGLVVLLQYTSVLPFHVSLVIVAGSVWLAMLTVSLRRCLWQTEYKFVAPRHIAEIARAFELVSRAAPDKIVTARTSQGIQVSASHTELIDHYSLSQRDGEMSEETARFLLRLAPRLAPESVYSTKVIGRNRRVFHLLVYRTAGN
ncbi:MAG TPA: prolipoprotein diacylglyceryl transferase family protein [Pyrinomonadaceae bacterium]|nr:prolipoprotein diacylglyceryl transferase family protein [Pyrinomonadaceae bacterium]